MALRGYDGFEGIAIGDIGLHGWTQVLQTSAGGASTSIVSGLNGSALRMSNGMSVGGFGGYRSYQTVTAASRMIIGGAFNKQSWRNSNDHLIYSFWEGGTCHLSVTVNDTGTFKIYRGRLGTVLGTSAAGLYTQANWAFLELDATINNSTGSATLYLEGTAIITLTGVDTSEGGSSVVDQIAVEQGLNNPGTSAAFGDFDNVYWLDSSGAAPYNAPLGPVKVDRQVATSDGATTDFTTSAGSDNFAMVDEALPNNDTDYNESGTATHKDIFGLADLATPSGTIFAVQTRLRARRTDADSISLIPSIISNAVEQDGASRSLGPSFAEYSDIFINNPDGVVAWSDASVNALQAAYRIP